jgi:hypothetical protein
MCPSENAPEQAFDPAYVAVIVIVLRFTCAIPVVVTEHPAVIIDPIGIWSVKGMSSASIVPETVPGIPFDLLAKRTVPVTRFPLWVSPHVISPMPLCPIIVPGDVAVVESDAVPAHVPVIDISGGDVGAVVTEPPPQAVSSTALTTTRQTVTSRIVTLAGGISVAMGTDPASVWSPFEHRPSMPGWNARNVPAPSRRFAW